MVKNNIYKRISLKLTAVFAAFAIVFGAFSQNGFVVFAAEPPVNNNGIISPVPSLTTDWRAVLNMKFYVNQIFDTARSAPNGAYPDPQSQGELYVLSSFQTPLFDASRDSMSSYETANPSGYYKIVRPDDFDETINEYELVFFSADDEPVVTVAERFVIGNLFNEGIFGNGRERDTGYFLFKDNLYETRAQDGSPSITYDFMTETVGRRFDGDGDGKSSGILLITPSGFNEPLVVYSNAQTPTIGKQPDSIICTQNGSSALSVSASVADGGTLSYQWYENTAQSNESGTPVSGATAASFTPPTDIAGTFYYYCNISNYNATVTGTRTVSASSQAVKVEVKAEAIPVLPSTTHSGNPIGTNGDATGIISSSDIQATAEESIFTEIFQATYSVDPGDGEQNIYDTDDQDLVAGGGYVVIEVLVEKQSTADVAAEVQARAEFAAADEIFPLDISLIKSLFNSDEQYLEGGVIEEAQTPSLLEIRITLPAELQGKINYKVIRKHGSDVTTLSTDETDPTKERIEVSGNTLTIYAKKFSDYVLIADNPPVITSPDEDYSDSSYSEVKFPEPLQVPTEIAEGKATARLPRAEFIIDEKTIHRAYITNPGGSVNAKLLIKNLERVQKIVSGKKAKITVLIRNAGLISYPTFDRIAEFSGKYGTDVEIFADNVENNRVTVRLIIDANEFEKTDNSLYLKAGVSEQIAVGRHFDKWFVNELSAIYLMQTGDLKTPVEIAVKPRNIKNTDNLVFYAYDVKTNKYKRIKTDYKIDENGYTHLEVTFGGYIIVSDGELERAYIAK
jgi:hypothetical protein